MHPRTRRDGRNHSGLRAIRGGCSGAARHIGDRPAGYGANGTPPVHAWAFLLASNMDGPVLIGKGQTMSQPFIVALMTHFAAVKSDHTVLEVGTGSGYQAAILARLVRKVCTVEIV